MQFPLSLIGRFPPPVGGVTVFNARLSFILKKRDNLLFKNVDLSYHSWPFLFIWRVINRDKIILSVSSLHFAVGAGLILSLTGQVFAVIVHEDLESFLSRGVFVPRLFIYLYKFKKVFLLNRKSVAYSVLKGFQSAHLVTAFLPPIPAELELVDYNLKNISGCIMKLTQIRSKFNFIYSTTAWSRVFDSEGIEIYGIDALIVSFIEARIPQSCLIVSDPMGQYFSHYKEPFAGSSNVFTCAKSDNIFFLSVPHSFVNILGISDCFVRNTSTDGDSISLREALCLGVSVLATNVVDRPPGVLVESCINSVSLQNIYAKSFDLSPFSERRGDNPFQSFSSLSSVDHIIGWATERSCLN